MPHTVHGGPAFFDRSEVRDLLAYLKVCVAPHDEVSLARIVNVPPRGIGDASLERVHAWAVRARRPPLRRARARRGGAGPAARRGRADRGVRRARRAAPRPLRGGAARGGGARPRRRGGPVRPRPRRACSRSRRGSARWTRSTASSARSRRTSSAPRGRRSRPGCSGSRSTRARRRIPRREEGVTLMTLHAAKGLEFPVVFLVGVEEDLLPCAGIQGEARDLDEERRLAYVGITRARERLYLTRAAARTKRGQGPAADARRGSSRTCPPARTRRWTPPRRRRRRRTSRPTPRGSWRGCARSSGRARERRRRGAPRAARRPTAEGAPPGE